MGGQAAQLLEVARREDPEPALARGREAQPDHPPVMRIGDPADQAGRLRPVRQAHRAVVPHVEVRGDLADGGAGRVGMSPYGQQQLVLGGRQPTGAGLVLAPVDEAAQRGAQLQEPAVVLLREIGGLRRTGSPWQVGRHGYIRLRYFLAVTQDQRLPADSVAGADERPQVSDERALGDFTLGPEVFRVVPLSIVVGALAAGVALALLDLIGFFTHVAYYGHVGVKLVPPTLAHLHGFTILVPVVGGLLVGLMARYGSERIRGHGIPEAMETILIGGSRVEPRLAWLKPVSSAISIGSGGPFGAEGPIILTGGAVGSVLAQFFRLSAIERRSLLVAGACGGMAAVFGTPVAAALFGIELLVFEWRPRSMVPVALSVVVAETIRNVMAAHGLVRLAPLFPVPAHGSFSAVAVSEAAAVGLAAGGLAWLLTNAVYGAEDAFKRLPIHWMWWPAIGGLVVGIGGLIEPRALGVGYATIGAELAGQIAMGGLVTVLLVKLVIW